MSKRAKLAAVPAEGPPPKITDLVPPDATHQQLVQALCMELALEHGADPVGYANALWLPDGHGLWRPRTTEQLAVQFAKQYLAGFKHCRKLADYKACATLAIVSHDRPDAFKGARVGVVCPGGLWTIDERHGLVRVDLKAEHLQRFALPFDPDFEAEPVLFDRFLDYALDEEQRDLAAQAIGAALFGLLHSFQLVLLLLGVGGAGKSVLQRVIESLFPPSAVTSVGPHRWGHEYYTAAMAQARINLVGELPEDQAIPAAPFKSVTGGDLQSARDPNHRPFFFRPELAHVFNSNTTPSTMDRSEAFFRRWRVLHFTKPVPPSERDPKLADRIVADELPAVLAWAMRGAERAAALGTLRTTAAHDAVMARWRMASNPVLLFLTDPSFCRLHADAVSARSAVYQAYRRWAAANGNRPMSNQKFGDIVDDTAGSVGVWKHRDANQRQIVGVELIEQGDDNTPSWLR